MLVLVLGAGSAGRRLARHLLALGERVLLYDPNLTPEARVPGALVCHDEEAAWRERGVEAVVVASPAVAHVAQAQRALARGLPLYLEKPVAPTMRDAEALLAYESVPTQVGYQMRSHRSALALRRETLDLGRVSRAWFVVASNMADWPGTTYGDALTECSHEVDAALWLLGPGEVARVRHPTEDSWLIESEHAAGTRSVVVVNGTTERPERFWHVHGARGHAHVNWLTGRHERAVEGRADVRSVVSASGVRDPGPDMDEAYQRHVAGWLRAIRTGEPTACGLRDGLQALSFCDAARRAGAKN